jgi:colanic acid/amylovoran biosynthesis glycosyltransferase
MGGSLNESLPRVAYFFTRFPYLTETFLQREVRAMRRLGLAPEIHSFHGEGPIDFEGVPVLRFSKWRLLGLFWRAAFEWSRHPADAVAVVRLLFTGWPVDWMNHWENLYGAGIAGVLAAGIRRRRIAHIHAAWASLPAMAAWTLSRLTGATFSMGAHAYDLFEFGGDWLLREKCAAATFVHTSTETGVARLLALGVPREKIVLARRGLDAMPACRPLRAKRVPLRVVCIARLVEKKGLLRQVGIYRALADAGLPFSARMVGEGPLRARLEAGIRGHHLQDRVTLVGSIPEERIWDELAAADVLIHTGVVAGSGDRDGLPNVVPEAMAAGVIVVTAPGEGVLEAVRHGATGLVCHLDQQEEWRAALRAVAEDDDLAERLRRNARLWVEDNFDAVKNAGLILRRMCAAAEAAPRPASVPQPETVV